MVKHVPRRRHDATTPEYDASTNEDYTATDVEHVTKTTPVEGFYDLDTTTTNWRKEQEAVKYNHPKRSARRRRM